MIPYSGFKNDEILHYLVGCVKLKEIKIALFELNNTWAYGRGSQVPLFFGEKIIQEFKQQADLLKKENYTIISVFHYPLDNLGVTELKPAGKDCFCVYDQIIEMSDICISGHLHGAKIKIPNLLGNKTQYFYSGAFCDFHREHDDCSASLIKINLVNKHIQVRSLSYSNEYCRWDDMLTTESGDQKTYFHLGSQVIYKDVIRQSDYIGHFQTYTYLKYKKMQV